MKSLDYLGFWKNFFILKIITPNKVLKRNLNGKSHNVSGIGNSKLRFPPDLPLASASSNEISLINKIIDTGLSKKDIVQIKREIKLDNCSVISKLYPYFIINNFRALSYIFGFEDRHIQKLMEKMKYNSFDYKVLKPSTDAKSYFMGLNKKHFRLLIQSDYYRKKAGIMVYYTLQNTWNNDQIVSYILRSLRPFFISESGFPMKSKATFSSIDSLRFDPKTMIKFLAFSKNEASSIKYRASRIGIVTKQEYNLAMKYKSKDNLTKEVTDEIRLKIKAFGYDPTHEYNGYISDWFGRKKNILFCGDYNLYKLL